MAVNSSKRQYVCPWCIGGTAKLFEWVANTTAGIFPYLLRRSNESGGGDLDDPETAPLAGSWAGDNIALVGDYDESKEFQLAFEEYENISPALAEEMNVLLGHVDLNLRVGLCGSCDPESS